MAGRGLQGVFQFVNGLSSSELASLLWGEEYLTGIPRVGGRIWVICVLLHSLDGMGQGNGLVPVLGLHFAINATYISSIYRLFICYKLVV